MALEAMVLNERGLIKWSGGEADTKLILRHTLIREHLSNQKRFINISQFRSWLAALETQMLNEKGLGKSPGWAGGAESNYVLTHNNQITSI